MLGFKLATPTRENDATQKTRPIYLDMQVREGSDGISCAVCSLYSGYYPC